LNNTVHDAGYFFSNVGHSIANGTENVIHEIGNKTNELSHTLGHLANNVGNDIGSIFHHNSTNGSNFKKIFPKINRINNDTNRLVYSKFGQHLRNASIDARHFLDHLEHAIGNATGDLVHDISNKTRELGNLFKILEILTGQSLKIRP
jgi:hypothetical protein